MECVRRERERKKEERGREKTGMYCESSRTKAEQIEGHVKNNFRYCFNS